MNVAKFHNVINRISEEAETIEIVPKLKELQSALKQTTGDSGQGVLLAFREKYSDISRLLEDCRINKVTPTEMKILEQMNAGKYVGRGLLNKITSIVEDNKITPANASQEMAKLIEEVEKFYETVRSIDDAFEYLNIERDVLRDKEIEVGIAIPHENEEHNITGLYTELQEIDFLFKRLNELTGEPVVSPGIRTLNASDFQVYVESVPNVAECMLTSIEKIVALYEENLEIKKLKQGLEEKSIPEEAIIIVDGYVKNHIEKGLEDIASTLIEEHGKGMDDSRKNELKTALIKSLGYIADKLNRGSSFEISYGVPEEPKGLDVSEEDLQFILKEYNSRMEALNKLNERGRELSLLPVSNEPVLEIESKETEEEESSATALEDTAPKDKAPKDKAPEDTAAEAASQEAKAPGQTAPGQTAPGHTAPGHTAPGHTAPGQAAPGQAAPRQAAPGHMAPGNTAQGQAVPGQVVPGNKAPADIAKENTDTGNTDKDS